MTIRELERDFGAFPLFSLQDLQKHDPRFHRRRLVEWQQKGYIRKLANAHYFMADRQVDEHFLHLASNRIYRPSYISLESALAHYGIIPEGVFTVTAVCTRKTALFQSDLAQFSYRKLAERLFWGYALIPAHGTTLRMALPEKAVLDYLYLNSGIGVDDLAGHIRWNLPRLAETISMKRLDLFTREFKNERLSRAADGLKAQIRHAESQ